VGKRVSSKGFRDIDRFLLVGAIVFMTWISIGLRWLLMGRSAAGVAGGFLFGDFVFGHRWRMNPPLRWFYGIYAKPPTGAMRLNFKLG
jgi:hypothetical protein